MQITCENRAGSISLTYHGASGVIDTRVSIS